MAEKTVESKKSKKSSEQQSSKKFHQCPDCRKIFCQAANLRRHLRIHTGEKPFQCPKCIKKFADSSSLTWHLITHSKKRNFKCDICDKEFYLERHLQRHEVIHSGDNKFECGVCGYLSQRLYSFRNHLKTHEKSIRDIEKSSSSSGDNSDEEVVEIDIQEHTSRTVGTKKKSLGRHMIHKFDSTNFQKLTGSKTLSPNESGSSSYSGNGNAPSKFSSQNTYHSRTRSTNTYHYKGALHPVAEGSSIISRDKEPSTFTPVSLNASNKKSYTSFESLSDASAQVRTDSSMSDSSTHNIIDDENMTTSYANNIPLSENKNNDVYQDIVITNVRSMQIENAESAKDDFKKLTDNLSAEYKAVSEQHRQLFSNVPQLICIKNDSTAPYTLLFKFPSKYMICKVCGKPLDNNEEKLSHSCL